MENKNCNWGFKSEIDKNYHDKEWCKVSHDDKYIFEMLILEGYQAGLSWSIILNKREKIREVFDNFDYEKIAKYSEKKLEKLYVTDGIIKSKMKIDATVSNAKAFIKVREEFGSFDKYIWDFVNNEPIINSWEELSEIPTSTELSIKISKDLKKRGFKYVGPVTTYSFMQGIGMVNDHIKSCEFK